MAEERAFPSTKTLLDHAPQIRALARGLLLDEGEADDLVQETWLAASRSEAPEVNRGAGWFTGIARNLARKMLRGRSRRRSHEQCASRSEPVSAYPEHAEMLEFHTELIEALTALDEPYRGVIYLRYFECLSFDEIATRTECPVPTVRSQGQRGLDLLKRRLTRDRDRDGLQGILVLLAHGVELPFHDPLGL